MSEPPASQTTPAMDKLAAHSGAVNGAPAEANDISMTDAPSQTTTTQPSQPQQQQPLAATPTSTTTATAATTTTATRVPTPAPAPAQQQQQQPTSRAASQHPDPATTGSGTAGFTMPAEAAPHGAPVRQYINSKITGVLLEGMKIVAREQPKDPLRVLGEYLLQRSKELEGKDGST
ncbi:hypothetical protein VTH82DRAFT_2559 [Thermothelomyces myriococcoides]